MSSEMRPYVVVAACIMSMSNGRVILHERGESASNPSIVGFLELPGGRVNLGEDLRKALKREIWEEMQLSIAVGDLVHAQVNVYDDGEDYLVLYYKCKLISIPLKAELRWFDSHKLDQCKTLPGTKEAVAEAMKHCHVE